MGVALYSVEDTMRYRGREYELYETLAPELYDLDESICVMEDRDRGCTGFRWVWVPQDIANIQESLWDRGNQHYISDTSLTSEHIAMDQFINTIQ